jgi:hypothetical protein
MPREPLFEVPEESLEEDEAPDSAPLSPPEAEDAGVAL